MALGYLLEPLIQISDNNGTPVVGASIYVYKHNTSVLATTYSDFDGHTNSNPVITDTLGNATVIADDGIPYDIVVRDSHGVEMFGKKNIAIGNSVSGAGDVSIDSGYGVSVTRSENTYTIAVDPAIIATQEDLTGLQTKLYPGNNIEIDTDNNINVVGRKEFVAVSPLKVTRTTNRLQLSLDEDFEPVPAPTSDDYKKVLTVTDEQGNYDWRDPIPVPTSNDVSKVLTVTDEQGNYDWLDPNGWALINADDDDYQQVTYAKICELDMEYDNFYRAYSTSFNVLVLNNGADGDPVESGTVDMTFYSQKATNMTRCEGRWSRYSTVMYSRFGATDNKLPLSIAGCFGILSSDRRHLEVWLKMTTRFNSLSTLAVSCTVNTGALISYTYGNVYETYKNPWKYINSHVYSKATEPTVPSDGEYYMFDAYQQDYYDASKDEVTVNITDLSSSTEFIVETPAWVPLGKLSLNADMQISVSDVSSFTPCTVTIKPVKCYYGMGGESGYDPDMVISSGFTKDTANGAQMGISCAMPIYDTSVSSYWNTVTDRFKISLDYATPVGDRTASTATLKIQFRAAYGNCESRTTHGDVRATWNT